MLSLSVDINRHHGELRRIFSLFLIAFIKKVVIMKIEQMFEEMGETVHAIREKRHCVQSSSRGQYVAFAGAGAREDDEK